MTTTEAVIRVVERISGQIVASTDTSLEALGFDSLDHVEVAIEIEEEFEIRVKDRDALDWVTVADIIDTVERASP